MSTKDSYRTPRAVYDFYDHQYHFVLDAAASDINARSPRYITEQQNTHETNWFHAAFGAPGDALGETHPEARTGHYVWMNPPYSNIGPFVETAIKWQAKGLGCVMLVMMDQSVGWFKRAVEHCQEVHLVIGGRLSFVDPVTEKPANGNNKGSMFLVFHPFGRPCDPRYRHIDRDEMLEGPVSLMRKSHSHIQGTIEQRPDDAEQGEPIIAYQVSAQIDIEEQIAREPVVHVVSFSGGRTSAYLVHLMEQKRKSENLDVRYVFMDTGAEHPKTYEFIRKVVNHYGIDLVCLRAKVDPKKGVGISYQIINLDDCKHDLQPWKDVLAKYGTPYIHGAFCTRSMKTDPIEKFIAAELNNVKVHQWLGIRVDEPKRLREKHGFSYLASISDFEKEDVLKFWQEMPFNLDIPEWLGNCVFCIKKGVNKIALAAKQEPELVQEFMSALESNDVKNVERKHGKLIMYRGHNSLTSIIETHINHSEQDLIQAMRGKTDSGSCSESCEAFACDENQDLHPVNAIWPIEVLNITKEVFALCGIEKPTETQFQEICEEVNRQRLEGNSTDSIIDDLVMNMPTEKKPCAA